MSTRLKTDIVRFSYAKVFAPDEDGLYTICLLLDKSNTAEYEKWKAAEQEAFNEGVTKKWGGRSDDAIKRIIRDGDKDRKANPEYKNKWFVNCKTKVKPEILDKETRSLITDPLKFYSGCYGKATINFFAYIADKGKSLGVGCGLGNLMKAFDGESLTGVSHADDDFNDEFEDEEADIVF